MRGYSSAFSTAFFQNYKELLSDLSLHPDFLSKLQGDDDWSFVVKLHSLMEIAISQLVSEHFGSKLEGVFHHLEMGKNNMGKWFSFENFH